MTIQLVSYKAGELLQLTQEKFGAPPFAESCETQLTRQVCHAEMEKIAKKANEMGISFCSKSNYYYLPRALNPETVKRLSVTHFGIGNLEERVEYLFKKCFETGIEACKIEIHSTTQKDPLFLLAIGKNLNVCRKNWLQQVEAEIINPLSFKVCKTKSPEFQKAYPDAVCKKIDWIPPETGDLEERAEIVAILNGITRIDPAACCSLRLFQT